MILFLNLFLFPGLSVGADEGSGEGLNKNELGKKKVGFSIQYLMSLMKGYDNSADGRKNLGKSIAFDKKHLNDLKIKKKSTFQEGDIFEGMNDEEKFFETERIKYKADMKNAERIIVTAPPKAPTKKEEKEKKIVRKLSLAANPKQQDVEEKENQAENSDEKEKSDGEQTNHEIISQFYPGESQERSMGYLKNIKMLKV